MHRALRVEENEGPCRHNAKWVALQEHKGKVVNAGQKQDCPPPQLQRNSEVLALQEKKKSFIHPFFHPTNIHWAIGQVRLKR